MDRQFFGIALKYRYWTLLTLIVGLVIGSPLLRMIVPAMSNEFNLAVLLATLGAASTVIGSKRFLFWTGGIIVLTLLVTLVGNSQSSWMLTVGWHVLLFAGSGTLAVGLLQQTLREDDVRMDTVMGVLCAYFMFGVAFAVVHSVIFHLDSTAYSGFQPGTPLSLANPSIYFSIVTLTTLGFGDIIPKSEIAQAVTALEAIFGQAYLAVVVARFVANEMVNARTGRQDQLP